MTRQRWFGVLGFAAPYLAGLWIGLVLVIAGWVITEQSIRDYAAFSTLLAPVTTAYAVWIGQLQNDPRVRERHLVMNARRTLGGEAGNIPPPPPPPDRG